jgi:hypothetical protein
MIDMTSFGSSMFFTFGFQIPQQFLYYFSHVLASNDELRKKFVKRLRKLLTYSYNYTGVDII